MVDLETFSLLQFGNSGLGVFLLLFIVCLKSWSLGWHEEGSEKVSLSQAASWELAVRELAWAEEGFAQPSTSPALASRGAAAFGHRRWELCIQRGAGPQGLPSALPLHKIVQNRAEGDLGRSFIPYFCLRENRSYQSHLLVYIQHFIII